MELSRRDLFKFGGIAAVGAAGAGMLAGCSPSGGSSKGASAAASKDTDGLPSFFQAPVRAGRGRCRREGCAYSEREPGGFSGQYVRLTRGLHECRRQGGCDVVAHRAVRMAFAPRSA